LKGFDDSRLEKAGQPLLVYDDGRGNQIYTIGVGKDLQLARRAMAQFMDLLGFQSSDLLIEAVNIKGDKLFLWFMRIPDFKLFTNLRKIIIERMIKGQLEAILQSVRNIEVYWRAG
jgi:hypothetical protein